MVEVGFTCIDPVAATGFPFNVTVVAFCVCQVRVAVCPGCIVVTFADKEAAGAGTPGSDGDLNPPQPASVKDKSPVKTAKMETLKRMAMARANLHEVLSGKLDEAGESVCWPATCVLSRNSFSYSGLGAGLLSATLD